MINSTFKYYNTQQRYSMCKKEDIYDEAIKDSFQVLRHWLEYKVPKWLSVMNSLQEYVSKKRGISPGNYLYYANLLENEFLPPNLSLLLEYNIPVSAIKKIMKFLPSDIDEDSILNYITKNKLAEKANLIQYERSFLE